MSESMSTARESPTWFRAKAASRTKEAVLLRKESSPWSTSKKCRNPGSSCSPFF